MKNFFPNVPDLTAPAKTLLSKRFLRAQKIKEAKRSGMNKESLGTQVYLQLLSGFLRKEERRKLKKEVLKAYGSACACCGEAEFDFLTIDHIEGDGKRDRASLGGWLGFYQHLKASGFPKDRYRAYCMNCNWASRHTGECPHRKNK